VQYKRATRHVLLLALAIIAPVILLASLPAAHALGTYTLYVLYPGYAQEGGTNVLSLTVTGANATTYSFRFNVTDPSTKMFHSILYNYTNPPGQTQFNLPVVVYPSPGFQGPTNLVGRYHVTVDQINPVRKINVASNSFDFIITDTYFYQRTQTVKIHAIGYNASEAVNVAIRPVGSTNVFSQNFVATASGVVVTIWKIPWNATLGYYIVTVTGTSTVKNPSDIQGILVGGATMTILSFVSSKSTYQRTETMQFSFRAVYPDNSNATTGTASITVTKPGGAKTNVTATYDSVTRTFVAIYKTSSVDLIGIWNATIGANYYDDSVGNIGPAASITILPQLIPAALSVGISVTTNVAVGQTLKLNATITYPDGTALQSGSVGAYMLYTGSPAVNNTIPIVFDSGLQLWRGSYPLQTTDPGGLWSVVVRGTDPATPVNTGSGSKAVTTQDHPPVASFNPSTTSASTGTQISLNGTASYDPDGTVATWSWTFGDGNSGLGSSTTHTYSSAGTYTVTLTVADNSGSTASTTSQITITDRPPTVSFSLSTATPTSGQAVTLSISASDPDGSVVTTKVDWGDGTVNTLSGSATSDSHSYASSPITRTYTITITVTDNSANTNTATQSVSAQASSNSSSNGNLSLPLYYFAILAAVVAVLLVGGFLAFRRHKVTHAKLKIDLEAVRSEAGRIENQEFFQSVKDQLKKDKDD
jgi:PKD repeat protein